MTKKFKIIIIDDQVFARRILKMGLEKAGFECLEAKNGRDGIERIKRLRPDLALLDIMMPDINGFQVLQEIRKDNSLQDLKIIMISALGQKSQKEQAFNLGADKFLQKPYKITDLIKIIKDILNISDDEKGGLQYLQTIELSLIKRIRTAVQNNEKTFIPKLPDFFTDKKYSSSIRCEAAIAVGTLKANEHVSYLIDALEDPDPMVREKVVWALGKLQAKRTFGKLCTMMRNQDETIDVKMAVAIAIKEMGEEDKVKPLLDSFKEFMKAERKRKRAERKKKRQKNKEEKN